MRKILLSILLSLFLFSCIDNKREIKKQPSLSTDPIKKEGRIFKYKTDNEDSTKIGLVKTEDLTISITSFCINGIYAYLTDEVHKNIKKINLTTGEMTNSKRITNKTFYKQFNDICVLKKKLYISSTGKTVFVTDLDFSNIYTFSLPTKGIDPVFIKSMTDSTIDFLVEFEDSIYVVNENNKVIRSDRLTSANKKNWEPKFDIKLGKLKTRKFGYRKTNEGEYIKINSKEIKLIKKFEYCSDIINLDFNDDFLVIFEINENEFILYVYDLRS